MQNSKIQSKLELNKVSSLIFIFIKVAQPFQKPTDFEKIRNFLET